MTKQQNLSNICPAASVFYFKSYISKQQDCKLSELIDFIPGVSLFDMLQEMNLHNYKFNDITLFTILFGISKFVYDYCTQKNMHGRIHTKNILIDPDFHPHILGTRNETPSLKYFASCPQQFFFIPPEGRIAKNNQTSRKSSQNKQNIFNNYDVYSLGVCIKHIITRKFPNIEQFKFTDEYNMDIDSKSQEKYEEQLMTLGNMCMNKDPKKRPTSLQVAQWIYQGASQVLDHHQFAIFNEYACTILPTNYDKNLICGKREMVEKAIEMGFIHFTSAKEPLTLISKYLYPEKSTESDEKSNIENFFENYYKNNLYFSKIEK